MSAIGTDLYLIAHKVRGEPAFDIAERIQIGAEEGWIIPTSGHRAYPYGWTRLDALYELDLEGPEPFLQPSRTICPPDLRDHYAANDEFRRSGLERTDPRRKPEPPATLDDILGALPS